MTLRVKAAPQRHCEESGAEFRGFRVDLAFWIADQPCPMAVRVEPVYLQTGA